MEAGPSSASCSSELFRAEIPTGRIINLKDSGRVALAKILLPPDAATMF